jgi:hypothetical protein
MKSATRVPTHPEVLSVRFERAMLERLAQVAATTERSMNQMVRLAVRAWLEDRER